MNGSMNGTVSVPRRRFKQLMAIFKCVFNAVTHTFISIIGLKINLYISYQFIFVIFLYTASTHRRSCSSLESLTLLWLRKN